MSSSHQQRRTALLAQNRTLFMNLLEDMPPELYPTFLEAVRTADVSIFKTAAMRKRIEGVENVFDMRLSFFKYDNDIFTKFLNRFIDEHKLVVNERPVPASTADLSAWVRVPHAHLGLFARQRPNDGDDDDDHEEDDGSHSDEATSRKKERKRKRVSSTAEESESSSHDRRTPRHTPKKPKTAMPPPPPTPPTTMVAPAVAIARALEHMRVRQEGIHARIVPMPPPLEEGEVATEEPATPSTTAEPEPPRSAALLSQDLDALNDDIKVLKGVIEQAQAMHMACVKDRAEILKQMHAMLAQLSKENEMDC